MDKVINFLKENSTFYFATVEEGKPRVRPFGFFMDYEGKLYFGMGDHKASYKQLLENPNFEVSTTSANGEWIRIKGTAVFDKSEKALEAAFNTMPSLRKIYNEETGLNMAIFYVENGDAEIAGFDESFEKIKF
ncbi:pyridoxamine 5'-phosphate oxidase family protein [Clostridium cibarium]|uniref:Pyridoxamine 5'-phosphate oxidase family protein n=1 Tax=Clostridium cibarium TaxID=2762247 RepID=A0ABR8PVE6_9CLOT|nr:pyridoxamine 5'-phosphate oxidase family protein [Clostridium cibarium]MBD7912139.1 pyridoxamine 5'-phosphate oxidase family protein [Clostridium cibarium]